MGLARSLNLAISAPVGGLHPFEPAGMTPFYEMIFSSTPVPNFAGPVGGPAPPNAGIKYSTGPSDPYGLLLGSCQRTGRMLSEGGVWNNGLVFDPTSPSRSGWFWRINYGAGLGDTGTGGPTGGGQPGIWNLWGGSGGVGGIGSNTEHGKQIWYEDTVLRVGDPVTKDFESHPIGQKTYGYLYSSSLNGLEIGFTGPRGTLGTHPLPIVSGFGGTGDTASFIEEWGLPTQSPLAIRDNPQNMNLGTRFTFGDWHRVVRMFTQNSALGVADGQIRAYLDGVLVHSYNNVMWRDATYPTAWKASPGRHWNITYGGSGGYVKARNDNIDFAYFYASILD